MKLVKLISLFAVLLPAVANAQDCAVATKKVTYYGNSTASCKVNYRTWQSINGKCADKYTEYTINQFVKETLNSTATITEKKIVADNKCTNGAVTQTGDVLVDMSCTANLPVSRTVDVANGQSCETVSYVDFAGQIIPVTSDINNIYNRVVTMPSAESTTEMLSWINKSGNTRIEYAINNGSSLVWKNLGLYGPNTTYTYVNYKTYFPSGLQFHGIPICNRTAGFISVTATPDVTLLFRIRSESFNGSAASAWSYISNSRIYYGSDKRCVYKGTNQGGGILF